MVPAAMPRVPAAPTFEQLDANRDGVIDRGEFERWFSSQRGSPAEGSEGG